jgi:hypothetical protein
MRMRRVVLYTVACPAPQLSTLSHKPTIFGKKLLLSETFLVLLKIHILIKL